MKTLEDYCRTIPFGGGIPEGATSLKFVGYDSSGTTIDPKGVLRLRETSTQDPFTQPREYALRRTVLDAGVVHLAEKIQRMNDSHYIDPDFTNKKRRILERFNLLRDVQEQVDNSLEDPTVYREPRGRLASNPVVNGVEYTVHMAWTQTQIGEGKLPYFLKGDELVVSDGSQQILANRYFSDPRVIVHGTFEGDVRKPENFNTELDEQTKENLLILFRDLYKDIEEVCFPNSDTRKLDQSKGE